MSLTPADKTCLIALLQDLRNGRPIGDQSAWLHKQVIDNAEARQLYADSLWLAGTLSFLLKGEESLEAESQAVTSTSKARVLRLFSVGSIGRSFSVLATSPIMATLLVAIVCYGTFAILAWNLRSGALPSGVNGNDVAVAMIHNSADVRWSLETVSKADNAPVHQGEPLKIDSGTIELELNTGTKLVVEGPADWSIDSENGVTLNVGTLVARVPKQAVGFTVATPTATIVDLGTEFGVEAKETGQTSVEVFKGQVEVNYLSASGHAQASRSSVRMSTGQAKQFNKLDGTAEITVVEVRPGTINRLAKTSLTASRQESQHYAAVVLADHPLGYWRLSDDDTSVAFDASGHGFNGSYNGAMRSGNRGLWPDSNDRCVRFMGPDAPGWLEMKDVKIPASFTVELWARSALPNWQRCAWLLASHVRRGLNICPMLEGRTWRFVVFDDDAKHCIVGYHTPEKIDDRFHHYVGTYDAATDRGCMYFDGARVGQSQPLIGDKRSHEPRKLTLYVGRDQPDGGPQCCGEGQVDEIAIYPTALSAAAVRHHFETSRDANPETNVSHE